MVLLGYKRNYLESDGVLSMKISTKGRYALRLMVDLAENSENGFVSLKDIAERQGISKKYLEQIIPSLNFAGFLVAGRGFQGGYKLSKSPSEYTVGDILRVTEGRLAPVSCLDTDANLCERSGFCDTLYIWNGLMDVVNEYLDGITLRDIINRKSRKSNDYVLL